MAVTEALIRVPTEVHERLCRLASDSGMSLPVYLKWLTRSVEVYSAEEKRERAEKALAALFAFSGYNPTEEEAAEDQAELERRFAHLVHRPSA